jgi:protein-S-isoprenylcysteine O-methyltransferase Ste14
MGLRESAAPSSDTASQEGNMGRVIALLFGLASYVVFFGTFLYAIGFVNGLYVPKTIDSGAVVSMTEALVINLLLLSSFAIQHSVMARQGFKRWWTRIVPHSIERSVYVLLASLILIAVFVHWRAMPGIVWQIDSPALAQAVLGLSFVGWAIVLVSTLLINHFELFGLRQVFVNLVGREIPPPQFRTPALYKVVRHPLYLGFIVAFWAAPTMTVGHLLFAAVTTAYILVAIVFEERDLIAAFGDEYRQYRQRVAMIVPFLR